jgi:YgiT-type zinc finger domain-containing protein
MQCPNCGQALAAAARDFGSEQGGVNVIITGVPAGRCEACKETFTTEATRRRMDGIAQAARAQAIEQGATEVTRPWGAAIALEAEQLGGELKGLADQLAAASAAEDPERLTETLAQVSAALKLLVARAREAGIALPSAVTDFAKDKPES